MLLFLICLLLNRIILEHFNFMNWIVRYAVLLSMLSATLTAQQDRIVGRVDRFQTRALTGNIHPRARLQFDAGPLDPSLRLDHVMLMFRRSNAQQTALDQLLLEQQTLSSPNYHNWLSPDQFGDRFGLSRNDTAKIASWLQSEGLAVDEISRGRNWVEFSGTAGQIQTALRTTLRRYRIDGELHFANAVEPSVPQAVEPLVAGVLGLDDFRPNSPRSPPLPFTPASPAVTRWRRMTSRPSITSIRFTIPVTTDPASPLS